MLAIAGHADVDFGEAQAKVEYLVHRLQYLECCSRDFRPDIVARHDHQVHFTLQPITLSWP